MKTLQYLQYTYCLNITKWIANRYSKYLYSLINIQRGHTISYNIVVGNLIRLLKFYSWPNFPGRPMIKLTNLLKEAFSTGETKYHTKLKFLTLTVNLYIEK